MRILLTILTIFISTFHLLGQGNSLYQFVGDNGKYGFIDKTGKIKIEPIYLRVHDFSEGLSIVSKEVVKKGYKWICIDTLGNEVFDIADNFPETNFSNGFARISSFTEHWFINTKGKNEFCKTWRNGYKNFKDGIAYVGDEEYSLSHLYPISTKGERIGNETWSFIEVFEMRKKLELNDNDIGKVIIAFQLDTLWGFKDLEGQVSIEPRFYKVGEFENGICPVRTVYVPFEFRGGYYNAVIDTTGHILTETEMYCYIGFQGELIEYYLGPHFSGGPHYLDKDGKIIEPKK